MKNSQNGFALPLLLVLIAALLIGGGVYVYEKNKQVNQPENVSQTTQTTSTTASQGNLFTNQSGRYSFEYPSEWNVAVNQYNNKNSLFGPNANSSSGLGGVEIFSNQPSIDKYLGSVEAQYTNKTNITIDGISGIRTHYKGLPGGGEAVVLLKNSDVYNIFVNSEKDQDIKLFEQIVSTFKFNP